LDQISVKVVWLYLALFLILYLLQALAQGLALVLVLLVLLLTMVQELALVSLAQESEAQEVSYE
jgi:hypothetical protein